MRPLNRALWERETHSKNEKSIWLCPECENSSLSLVEKDLREVGSFYTKSIVEHEDFDHEWAQDYYSAVLQCTNSECGEAVVCTGKLTYEHKYDYDIKGQHHEWIEEVCRPIFFMPALKMFHISENVNQNIRTQIEKSFSHFFNDASAAANSARTALEMIMDDQDVTNTQEKKKKYKLHERIELFGNQNMELKPYLMATKLTGNAGSHNSELSRDELLDSYELLNHCLDELYDKPARLTKLNEKVESINSREKTRRINNR